MVATNTSIHRVVTSFLLSTSSKNSNDADTPGTTIPCTEDAAVAVFHRCATMPTFANHWAGISGSIEDGETPLEAAKREIQEETNIIIETGNSNDHEDDDTKSVTPIVIEEQGGLYLDVPYVSPRNQKERIIRVYPFVVRLPEDFHRSSLELKGTEHDRYEWVSVSKLQQMKSECVPGLVEAFHHATYGICDTSIHSDIWKWSQDKENGATIMTANALELLQTRSNDKEDNWKPHAKQIGMLRPSMVPIVNVMNLLLQEGNRSAISVDMLRGATAESVQECREAIRELQAVKEAKSKSPIVIATFSRSGTLRQVLESFVDKAMIICGQSTPGNEGELMALDLKSAQCFPDAELSRRLENSNVCNSHDCIDLFSIGADCVLSTEIVNKVGTRKLCEAAQTGNVPVFCCVGQWKVWNDKFPPPLEKELFELVPKQLITRMFMGETDSGRK